MKIEEIYNIENEIKKLQVEKEKMLNQKKIEDIKKHNIENMSKKAMLNLYGMSKKNAQRKVVDTIISLYRVGAGASEVFGINTENCYIPTSITIEDIKKDEFFINMLISTVGMKSFLQAEKADNQHSNNATNIMKNFYRKLGNRDIVKYLKTEYPIKQDVDWILRKDINGTKERNYLLKIGRVQKNGRIGLYLSKKLLGTKNIEVGERIAIALVNNEIWIKKDIGGYCLALNGDNSEMLKISLASKELNVVANTIFNICEGDEKLLIFKKDK